MASDRDWLGKVVRRKKVGDFVFVQHKYPQLAQNRLHSHPWLHLSIVQRGQYSRSLGRHTSYHRAGTMSLLTSEEAHTDSYAPGTKCLHMVIPSDFEAQLTRDFGRQSRMPIGPAHSINPATSVALYREFQNTDQHSPLVIEAVLLDFVSKELGMVAERSRLRPPWIRAVLEYFDDACDQPWSLSEVARNVGVHPVHVCRAFSTHLGLPLGQYVRKLRLLRGWQLLCVGHDGRIADIAHEVGFADESHFSRVFKKAFGASPGRYRRGT